MRPRGVGLAAVLTAVLVVAACGLEAKRGVEIGHLRDLAERVQGGGAECPLAIAPEHLRFSTVDDDTPIVPLRLGGPGSMGVIGDGLPTDDSVRITCRYRVADLAVTVDVAAVTEGNAIAVFSDRLGRRGEGAVVLPFIDEHERLAVGRAAVLPGDPPGAFARVQAATGDVAVVLSVDRLDEKATLPDADEVRSDAVAIAARLAD